MRQEVQCINDRAYRFHKGLEPRYLLFELRNFPMIIAYELAPTVNQGYKQSTCSAHRLCLSTLPLSPSQGALLRFIKLRHQREASQRWGLAFYKGR